MWKMDVSVRRRGRQWCCGATVFRSFCRGPDVAASRPWRAIASGQPEELQMATIDPLTAGAVLLATAATDAVYVMFTSAVVARKRVPAATWSSVWYLLSSYAVISYTENWIYVAFAAVGSWVGAYVTITFLHRPPGGPPVGAAPE
jgi:hypothetical protein